LLEKHLKSIETLWSKVEKLDFDLPPIIEEEIKKAISNFYIPEIAFKRVYPRFERLTINKDLPIESKRIQNVKYLYNPPAKFINSYGRANLKNQSIFYATFLTPTAISELGPQKGYIITISNWKLLTPFEKLNVYPIHKYKSSKSEIIDLDIFAENRSNQIDTAYNEIIEKFTEKERKIITGLSKFIANCFSKNIKAENNSLYVITATLANKIFYEMFDNKIEAITYPSVKDSTKIANIAL
jgi:hypothetical protein